MESPHRIAVYMIMRQYHRVVKQQVAYGSWLVDDGSSIVRKLYSMCWAPHNMVLDRIKPTKPYHSFFNLGEYPLTTGIDTKTIFSLTHLMGAKYD